MPADKPTMLTRADISAAYGYSTTTLDRWWADRATNGHPPAHRIGRTLYWDAAEWETWDKERQQLVGVSEFARILGHRDHTWVSKAATTPPPGFPPPVLWGDPQARQRPQWNRADAVAFAATPIPPTGAGRPRGARTGTAYAGDPRLTLALQTLRNHPDDRTTQLIARLDTLRPGSSPSTWTKILQAARQHPEA